MKNVKNIVLVVVMIALLIPLASCGSNDEEEEASIGYYTEEQMAEAEIDGFFAKIGEDAYAPILNDIPGYSGGGATEENPERYIWFTDSGNFMSDTIPVVSKDMPLVAVFNADKDMPGSIVLEKYNDLGFTVGTHFYFGEGDDLLMDAKNMLAGSSAEANMPATEDETVTLESVSGTADGKLPVENIDMNISALLNLEQDKVYEFKAFRGTKLDTFKIYADTHIYQGGDVIPISNPYQKTGKGYFIVNLPKNLEAGYYYVDGMGLFRYE